MTQLITPSLLNSFLYYVGFDGEDEAEARADFLRTLSREPYPPTESQQRGIDFENAVHAYCKGVEWDDPVVRELGDICRGGVWQQAVKRELDGFLLYGKTDVIKLDTIYDIKMTKSYDVGKYQKSSQHRLYLYCSNMPKFSYLVSDGRNWWREDYYNHADIEQEIRSMIRELMAYLERDHEAGALYAEKWGAKP